MSRIGLGVLAVAGLLGLTVAAAARAEEHGRDGSQNLRLIRSIHEGGGSIITAFRNAEVAAPEVEWWVAGPEDKLPFAGTWHGADGVAEFQSRLNATVRYDTVRILEYVDGVDQVAVIFLGEGIALKSGRPFRSTIVRLFTFEDGKVVRVRNFFDTAAYVRAIEGE